MKPYDDLAQSRLGAIWSRLGAVRRAGVAVPLFSIYSAKSAGIGEFPDLKPLADWCSKTGLTIIQLLPVNDMGTTFRPYDAESSTALDPVHLRPSGFRGVYGFPFEAAVAQMREDYGPSGTSVRYAVKAAKLDLFWKMFEARSRDDESDFESFRRSSAGWLRDYALYRVIKEIEGGKGWESWPESLRARHDAAIAEVEWKQKERLTFYAWLQWQAALQFQDAKEYAGKKGVLFLGDLPFLVARDSADVWAHQHYFKLDRVAGAPPDAFFSKGQRWGMPPYNWEAIAHDGFDYLKTKFGAASRLYDIFRIDHVVGVFRVWTIHAAEPAENHGLHGTFDPPDESGWEGRGRWILDAMTSASPMLPCAEDLGVVPPCSYPVLKEYGIPGIEIQRWTRDWAGSYDFRAPRDYRPNSVAMLSTHDSTFFAGWWAFEAGTVDTGLFERLCGERGINYAGVSGRLFESFEARNGRARWRSEMSSAEAVLGVLQRSWDEARPLLDLWRGSFDERPKFLKFLGLNVAAEESEVAGAAVQRALEAESVFCVHMLWDWLSLDPRLLADARERRINVPGTVADTNWSLLAPVSLEKLNRLGVNKKIIELNRKWNR